MEMEMEKEVNTQQCPAPRYPTESPPEDRCVHPVARLLAFAPVGAALPPCRRSLSSHSRRRPHLSLAPGRAHCAPVPPRRGRCGLTPLRHGTCQARLHHVTSLAAGPPGAFPADHRGGGGARGQSVPAAVVRAAPLSRASTSRSVSAATASIRGHNMMEFRIDIGRPTKTRQTLINVNRKRKKSKCKKK